MTLGANPMPQLEVYITIVTGLWNINRDGLTEGWSRTFQHYLDKFDQLLQIENNMIIFGEPELESFVLKDEIGQTHNLLQGIRNGLNKQFLMTKYKKLGITLIGMDKQVGYKIQRKQNLNGIILW